jgi:hypothetical protein
LNPRKQGLIIVAMVCIALLVVGVGSQNSLNLGGSLNFGGDPDDGGVTYDYPTPTPTRPPGGDSYYDSNTFSITQRVDEEYVYGDTYYPPTSYRTVANIEEVIVDPDYEPYSHAIGVWGTYANWEFDVYIQVGGDGMFWFLVDNGITDGDGSGYANIPFYASDAGQIHTVVAVIDPDGGGAPPVNYGGFTAGELSGLVADGTLRQSNILSFDVIATAVL